MYTCLLRATVLSVEFVSDSGIVGAFDKHLGVGKRRGKMAAFPLDGAL
jgi:hypothetical protein